MNIFEEKPLFFLDGATGTMLQKAGLQPGQQPELLNIENPALLQKIHRQYAQAGAQMVLANTFGANALKCKNAPYSVEELIAAGIKNAKAAVEEYGTLTALDIGPLGQMLEPAGTLSFEEAYEAFAQMVKAGVQAGADAIFIETMADLQEARAALLAAKEHSSLPVLVSMSFEENGHTYMGVSLESMAVTLSGLHADAIGFNCSVGPDQLKEMVERLSSLTSLPVIAKPNAGLPDARTGAYSMDPAAFAEAMKACQAAGAQIVGGCCGTSPAFIKALKEALEGAEPQPHKKETVCRLCGPAVCRSTEGFVKVGERINPAGKKRVQKALTEQNYEDLLLLGLEQQAAGADVLDVNVGYPGIDEETVLPLVVKKLQSAVDLPLMLDSSNPKALENALRIYNGRAIINSVNGSKKSMAAILPLAAKYGAALVGLCMDENGIPSTASGRVEIAEKIAAEAAAYGIAREDLWMDPLCLTVSAQQKQAMETLEAVRILGQERGLHTILGISNISFGLPARTLLTGTFLTMAMEAGLSAAILNVCQPEMMDTIAASQVLLQQDLHCRRYIERFADRNDLRQRQSAKLSLQEAVISGLEKEAAQAAVQGLEKMGELELVETQLIPALDAAGSAYEQGRLYLPSLLQAARAAQAVFAVIKASLEEKGEQSIKKGPVLMATVQGDIHDIGKNIVCTILENYGYDIIDLGKDVPPETIVQIVREKKIRLVGLSALMTTTLPAMEKTVQLLRGLEEPVKIMVGGAVVTQAFADSIGADFYCKDANDNIKVCRSVFHD